MTNSLRLRRFAAAALFLIAIRPALSQSSSPMGAWMSCGRWNAAPREVNRDLRATGAQIIYFEVDGAFTLWSGTLYSEAHHLPTISEGDAETLYSGVWTQTPSGPTIKMRKVYADVRMRSETIPSPEETVTTKQRTGRILFKGLWFTRNPSLDGQMQKYALEAKQRLDQK